MKAFVVSYGDLAKLIDEAKKSYTIYGPVRKGGSYVFSRVDGLGDMELNYNRTILPPKKFFHLPYEVLMKFKLRDGFEIEAEAKAEPIMVFGVHPCDLNAILRLDEFFSRKFEDPYYLSRREKSLIVVLNCRGAKDEYCFCASLNTGPIAEGGYDLALTELEAGLFLLEVGSPKGDELVEKLNFPKAEVEHLEAKERIKAYAKNTFHRRADFEGLVPAPLDHPVWEEEAKKCFSCGTCSLVCPTCYCYDIYDEVGLSLKEGIRVRRLDSCQLYEYSEVALGGNFRRERKARLRHWMTCKFGGAGGGRYSSCVGCGRCISLCPAGIDITEVASKLKEVVKYA
ncbi:MAG: hydrogenase [Thermofilum sp. ex4484_15]|nr:MAG: hydrogenase [Thermofilum sp. ex4484_15]